MNALKPAEQLRLIREKFAHTSPPEDVAATAAARVTPELLQAWFKQPLRPAAVLLPITERNSELQMLFTERTHTVRDHPGQVAFPGGTAEPADQDLLATALRESTEEIGLQPSQVEILGYLPAQAVISGYAVLPVVGQYDPAFTAEIDPREVASVFEVPLNYLLDSSNMIRVDRDKNGVTLPTYEYQHSGYRIWGATALMVRQFVATLA